MSRCYYVHSLDVLYWLSQQAAPVSIEQAASGLEAPDRLMLVLVLGVLSRAEYGYVAISAGAGQFREYTITEQGKEALRDYKPPTA